MADSTVAIAAAACAFMMCMDEDIAIIGLAALVSEYYSNRRERGRGGSKKGRIQTNAALRHNSVKPSSKSSKTR